jgi:hypothetical protein
MNQYFGQKVTAAQRLGGYRLRVTFADGFTGEVDLSPLVGRGPIFEPLRDLEFFQRVKVSPEWGVLEWPGDLDLSPGAIRAWCEAGKFMDFNETDKWIDEHAIAPKSEPWTLRGTFKLSRLRPARNEAE